MCSANAIFDNRCRNFCIAIFFIFFHFTSSSTAVYSHMFGICVGYILRSVMRALLNIFLFEFCFFICFFFLFFLPLRSTLKVCNWNMSCISSFTHSLTYCLTLILLGVCLSMDFISYCQKGRLSFGGLPSIFKKRRRTHAPRITTVCEEEKLCATPFNARETIDRMREEKNSRRKMCLLHAIWKWNEMCRSAAIQCKRREERLMRKAWD